MTEKEKMLTGRLYMPGGEEFEQAHIKPKKILNEYNSIHTADYMRMYKLLSELFNKMGNDCYIEPPFRCEYGSNITLGNNFYANFDCLFLDVGRITIGNNVLFGPRVSLYTASHPIDAEIRNSGLEFAKEINIGNNVWIGGSVVINPGVTIGDNTVIGSGSVVTKDIPANVVAAGNPCKIIRNINEEDKKYWQKLKEDYYNNK